MSCGQVVVAVVPLFNPSARLPDTVARLQRQCDHVVLVDDGSTDESWIVAAGLASERVSVIRPGGNHGIAAALNAGIRHARARGSVDFVLTCDQDSFPSDLYVAAALNRFRQTDQLEEYALLAASVFNGQRIKTRIGSRLEPLEPIQSGMIIRVSAFDLIGHFREDLFIDCVDTDFFMRCRSAGLKTMSAPPCPFEHRLGEARWGSSFANRYARHPPWRTFFAVRNRLKAMQLYGTTDLQWAVRIIRIVVGGLIATLAISPDRAAQWSAIRMGYASFRRGESGPLSVAERTRLVPKHKIDCAPSSVRRS